jgi:hypothetical protein
MSNLLCNLYNHPILGFHPLLPSFTFHQSVTPLNYRISPTVIFNGYFQSIHGQNEATALLSRQLCECLPQGSLRNPQSFIKGVPLTLSVRLGHLAMIKPQPKALNFTALILLSLTLINICMISVRIWGCFLRALAITPQPQYRLHQISPLCSCNS